jgi:hypothetical protein
VGRSVECIPIAAGRVSNCYPRPADHRAERSENNIMLVAKPIRLSYECDCNLLILFIFLVPAEGFEPPTYGLQNRCTTTVLSRLRSRAPL